MSSFDIYRVDCPSCGGSQEAELFRSINGARVPGAIERILTGRLHIVECEHCGEAFAVEKETLYTHLPNRQWVVVHHHKDMVRFRELEKVALEIFRREYLESAPAFVAQEVAGMKRRVVFGNRQWAEKIRIWSAGLDDSWVECLKLWLHAARPQLVLRPGGTELCLMAIDDDGDTLVFAVIDDDNQEIDRLSVPSEILGQLRADEAEWRAKQPQLFGDGFVHSLRLLRFDDAGAKPQETP